MDAGHFGVGTACTVYALPLSRLPARRSTMGSAHTSAGSLHIAREQCSCTGRFKTGKYVVQLNSSLACCGDCGETGSSENRASTS